MSVVNVLTVDYRILYSLICQFFFIMMIRKFSKETNETKLTNDTDFIFHLTIASLARLSKQFTMMQHSYQWLQHKQRIKASSYKFTIQDAKRIYNKSSDLNVCISKQLPTNFYPNIYCIA